MSLHLEQQLRDTLLRQSEIPESGEADPWATFTARERKHRNGTRARRLVTGVAAAGLIAAVGAGVVHVPEATPGIRIGQVAHAILDDAPPRGSLAGNAPWLNGFREKVQLEDEQGWRIVNRDDMQVHFAGDVPGARVVLVTYDLQWGLLKDKHTAWYSGPVDASPAELELTSTQDPEKVSATLNGDDAEIGYFVVVGPVGSQIQTSLGATPGADGRLNDNWKAGTDDGVAVVAVPPSERAPAVRFRITQNGRELPAGTPSMSWTSAGGAPQVAAKTVTDALAAARGAGVDRATATRWVRQAVADAKLNPATTGIRIPWTGTMHGESAALIQLKPAGGGVAFYAYHGTGNTGTPYLRLLAPAKDADTRPILWRERDAGGAASTTVDVVLPAGTKRAELVRAGTATPLSVARNGFATTKVPVGEEVSVRAYAGDGTLLGSTPLPELETDMQSVLGANRNTRLVD